jgi:AraC-like DNA-binding protein
MRNLDANARVEYREFPVPDTLRRQVAGVWLLRDEGGTTRVQTIYPDGYCELIVHAGTPPECHEPGGGCGDGWHPQARTLFASQRLSAVRLRRDAPLHCLGVRLRPEASDLLGAGTLRRTRDRIVDLAGIDPGLSQALGDSAPAFLAGDPAPLWHLLERRCAGHRVDEVVARTVEGIRAGNGQERIESLARGLGIGLRTLQSRFVRVVGLTPKEFARVVRLQAVVRALDDGGDALCDVAADHGFADQAHAARELRRVTGLAPSRLRAALRADRDGDASVRLAAAFVRGTSRPKPAP